MNTPTLDTPDSQTDENTSKCLQLKYTTTIKKKKKDFNFFSAFKLEEVEFLWLMHHSMACLD